MDFKKQVDQLADAAYKAECDKQGKEVRKVIHVPNKLMNFVVSG